MKIFLVVKILIVCFLTLSFLAYAHNGQEGPKATSEKVQGAPDESTTQPGRPTTWTQWIGSFHLIFLHFPIALINMLAVSELLFSLLKRPIFDFSARFLIISAAILTPLTSFLGYIYSYTMSYGGFMEIYLLSHMWLGIASALVVVVAACVREQLGRTNSYCLSIILLFLMVNLAGFFGGGMTFGPYQLLPP